MTYFVSSRLFDDEDRARTRDELDTILHGDAPDELATEIRDAAIRRVERNAAEDFMHEARLAVYRAARAMERFTTEHLKDMVQAQTHEPRAWGAAVRHGQKAGWIKAGGYVPSARKESHCRPVREWHSLIHGAGEL